MGGGVGSFVRSTRKLESFCKGFINPWGASSDRWQSFVTDGAGSGGINFVFPQSVFATSPARSESLMDSILVSRKQAGLEIVMNRISRCLQGNADHLRTFAATASIISNSAKSGSGYLSKQLPDVLASKHAGFRPIDVRPARMGALYIGRLV